MYDLKQIQKDHDAGLSFRGIRKKYGIDTTTLCKAVKDGLFISNKSRNKK